MDQLVDDIGVLRGHGLAHLGAGILDEAFQHILNSASGVVRVKIDELLGSTVPRSDRDQLATLIYYPEEKLEEIPYYAIDPQKRKEEKAQKRK